MTQKNMNKKIVNIPYFIWVMFIFFVFSGNASTYANEAPGGAGNQNEATLRLLSVVKNASTSVEEIVELIQEGALVNAADSRKCTPLMFAAEENSNPDVLKVLIEVGALVNATDRNGFTPLMRAAAYNSNPQIMRDLIERGADVAIRCRNGKTALDYAGGYSENLSDEYKFLWKSTVTALKNHTEELSSHMASVSVEDAAWLIQEGADVNAKDSNGKTPLMIAAQYSSNPDILRLLIENKADVGIKDKEGKRAIDYAEGNEQLKQLQSYNLRGVGIADDIDFNLYHPWSNKPTRLPRLDVPVSLSFSGDYPRVDGATSAYPIYAAIVNEVYAINDKAELQQYLFCSKTTEAYNRLISGEADIIFVLQPSDEQLELARNAGVELHFTPIAKDAFVFFVNSSNPVSDLSIEQIRNIYQKKITNWREVGGNDRKILPYQRQVNSGSQTAMLNEVMKGEELPPPLAREHSVAMFGIVREIAVYRDEEESIGYSFQFYINEMMRDVLKINLTPESEKQSELDENNPIKLLSVDSFAPSVENIRNGTYPITVDIFAVTTGNSNPHVTELLDWMLSPEGQELIEKTGYVGR